jgi:hypothetical protein
MHFINFSSGNVELTQRVRRLALSELVEVREKLADEVLAILQYRCILRSLLYLSFRNNDRPGMPRSGDRHVSG